MIKISFEKKKHNMMGYDGEYDENLNKNIRKYLVITLNL